MAKRQHWLGSHAETITQNVVGVVIGYAILTAFGLSSSESLHLQVVFFVASYTRGYIIRRVFARLEERSRSSE